MRLFFGKSRRFASKTFKKSKTEKCITKYVAEILTTEKCILLNCEISLLTNRVADVEKTSLCSPLAFLKIKKKTAEARPASAVFDIKI